VKALLRLLLPSIRGVIAAALGGFWATSANCAASVVAPASEASVAVAGGGATVTPYTPPSDPQDLLKVDAAMRSYFEPLLTAPAGSSERLQQIVDALLKRDGLNFAYDIEGTYGAPETFRRRSGNCVSYSLLIVALAREFGFTASFQNVMSAARWTRFGSVVASVTHLNVRVETDDGLYLVDLRTDLLPTTRIEAMEVINDARAFSEFYDTVGLFRLVHGATEEARWCMQRATEVDPSLAANWRNLANVHARMGNWTRARSCFERALRVDRHDLSAASSLLEILRRSGTPEDMKTAATLERRAQAMRDMNPYWQEHLAQVAEEHGDWIEAEKRYRRAIALNGDEPDFYASWIAVLRRLGRNTDAQRAELKLEKVRARLNRHSIHFAS
jgi:tetratricopeptide (TPR) repeat protein